MGPAKRQDGGKKKQKTDEKEWFDGEVYYEPPFPAERYYKDTGRAPVDPVEGKVTKQSVFFDAPDDQWWPTQVVVEGSFDAMGTAEEVAEYLDWDNLQFTIPTWVSFEKGVKYPREKKAGDFQFQSNSEEPRKSDKWGEDFKGNLIRQVKSFAGHYCTLDYQRGSFVREASRQVGTYICDTFSFGPSHCGREDCCSVRFRMRLVAKPYFMFVLGPLLKASFTDQFSTTTRILFNLTVAANYQKRPDAVVVPFMIPPPCSKMTKQALLYIILGMGFAYAKSTALLSWLLTLLFGEVFLFGAWPLRVLLAVLYMLWFMVFEFLPESDLGIKKKDWESAANTFFALAGTDRREPGEVVTPPGKIMLCPVEVDPKTRKVTKINNRYTANILKLVTDK